MASPISKLLTTILPRSLRAGGVSSTSTFNASNSDTALAAPDYKEHLKDLFQNRLTEDSRTILQQLFITDPDVSAAVNAYLSVANTEPFFVVRTPDGFVDRAGQQALNQLLLRLMTRFDYSTGFQMIPSLRSICENMRYMILLRGAVAAELVFDKQKLPADVRQVDPATIEWYEKKAGVYKPHQLVDGSDKGLSLDIPNFFVSFFRRDPTKIYTYSPFVSTINTVAARQQVINDLYRIMQLTGFPRLRLKVLEEVIVKNAPANIKSNPEQLKSFVAKEVRQIVSLVTSLSSDQVFVHTEAVEAGVLNEKNPAAGMNIDSIISALNAQNQAGLRAMATILGRGESGVNTASVEARIFAMNAEEINEPIAEIWSNMLTMALRLVGFEQSYVEFRFRRVELRPDLELEPQRVMKAARLKEDLSLGIIDDDEYHLQMYGRLRPDHAPVLTGTNFMSSSPINMNTDNVTPNSDPLGRSIAPDGGSRASKSNQVKKL